ncbi:MAG: magnesium transporter, partial [Acinetobacter junii]
MSYNNFLYLLSDALKNNHIELALASLKTFRPVDIADVLTQLSLDQSQLLLTHLPDRAYVFSYLAPNEQVKLAKVMPRNTLAEIIGEMSSDKRADVFKCLDEDQQNALLPALAQAEREDIRQLASYLEGTAGAIMSSEYATLKPNMQVNEAIKMLRLEAPDTETIYFAYVLDEARKLLGVLSLKQLILAAEDQNINLLMETNVLTAYVDTDQDEVAKTIARYDLLALPIIDRKGMMVGIVTYDDAMDVASEEATEDF